MSRGWARYHLLVYASYTWKFSFKKNCNCNWFMLHIQNLKRLIDTEWDCYLMVSTLSFLNFDLYQYYVIFFFFFSQGYVILYCVHTHLIIILCIIYTSLWNPHFVRCVYWCYTPLFYLHNICHFTLCTHTIIIFYLS